MPKPKRRAPMKVARREQIKESQGPATGTPSDGTEKVLRLLGGKWVTAALATACQLRIPEALEAGPTSLESLAGQLQCDPSRLRRILRVLCAEGLVIRCAKDQYKLSDAGQSLRQDQLGALASMVGAPFSWQPWSLLSQSLRRTETKNQQDRAPLTPDISAPPSAFELHHGMPLFAYLDAHEEDADLYHRAVDAFTTMQAKKLANQYDFSQAKGIVDIGGGRGSLLLEVRRRWPHLHSLLIDRDAGVQAAKALRRPFDDHPRERDPKNQGPNQPPNDAPAGEHIWSGDFFCAETFEAIGSQFDTLILKHVLHNWDDTRALVLLRHCARHLHKVGGTLLIIEGVLLPDGYGDMTALLDMEMLALCGSGRERSKPEMRALIGSAGLRIKAMQSLEGMTKLFVCEAVDQQPAVGETTTGSW